MSGSKELVAASAAPLILSVLAQGDNYGYAIIKRVAELTGGHMHWTDGMLYPVLHRLERQGYIEAQWRTADSGRKRRYYQLRKDGKKELAEHKKRWQAVNTALVSLWEGQLCSI